MQKLTRQILTELLWLPIFVGLAIALSKFLYKHAMLTGTIDIYLHDTYYIIDPIYGYAPLFFLIITFLGYFIKQTRNSFNRTLPNLILLITGSFLLLILTLLMNFYDQIPEWTLYPPLSALPELDKHRETKYLLSFIPIVQIAVLVMLLYASYRWGMQKKK